MRKNPHRPGTIIPVDYVHVLWYSLFTTVNGWPQPAANLNLIVEMRRDPNIRWATTGGTGKCSVCGANFIYGEVWKHEPTGEHIHVGHDCADKYSMVADRTEWEAWHETQKRERATAILAREKAKAREEFFASHPGMAEALALRDQDSVLADMYRKLNYYGSLSENQCSYARKIADRILNPPAPEAHVPAPQGRVEVTGTVVSVKEHSTQYGDTYKMTVKVGTPDGSWLVWVTVPASFYDLGCPLADLRGTVVQFTATLSCGREPHFAFGKRPSRAKIIS